MVLFCLHPICSVGFGGGEDSQKLVSKVETGLGVSGLEMGPPTGGSAVTYMGSDLSCGGWRMERQTSKKAMGGGE